MSVAEGPEVQELGLERAQLRLPVTVIVKVAEGVRQEGIGELSDAVRKALRPLLASRYGGSFLAYVAWRLHGPKRFKVGQAQPRGRESPAGGRSFRILPLDSRALLSLRFETAIVRLVPPVNVPIDEFYIDLCALAGQEPEPIPAERLGVFIRPHGPYHFAADIRYLADDLVEFALRGGTRQLLDVLPIVYLATRVSEHDGTFLLEHMERALGLSDLEYARRIVQTLKELSAIVFADRREERDRYRLSERDAELVIESLLQEGLRRYEARVR